ncbi:glycosyltransferase [Altericista sp. CCNU0014]|uniref:glycosyltransferase n=1 Tax=Altericista sp. CCNU0014 TaxID=3082949 RepID=UPI00384BB3F4
MDILHVIASVDPQGGGPVEVVLTFGLALARMGHHSEVLCLDAPDAEWLPDFPLQTFALGPGISSYQYSRHLVPWLQKNQARYSCIIIHGIWRYSSFGAWLALRRHQTPYYVFTHGMLDPWFKKTYPLKHLKKWLFWPWSDYRVLRDAAAVLFTCQEEKELARHSFWLYDCNEAVVPLGIAAPQGDAVQQKLGFLQCFPQLENKRLMLYLGRIHPKKGCDLLLEAFAAVVKLNPNFHLVIAGPDSVGWQNELQLKTQQLEIESHVTWPGMLSGDLKWGALRAAEVFVLPSHQENFGIAIVEAMACGLPAIVSNKVNIWREIQADGAGLVVEDTLAALTQATIDWMGRSPESRRYMGQRARESFSQNFEVDRSARRLLDILSATRAKNSEILEV